MFVYTSSNTSYSMHIVFFQCDVTWFQHEYIALNLRHSTFFHFIHLFFNSLWLPVTSNQFKVIDVEATLKHFLWTEFSILNENGEGDSESERQALSLFLFLYLSIYSHSHAQFSFSPFFTVFLPNIAVILIKLHSHKKKKRTKHREKPSNNNEQRQRRWRWR